MASGICELFKKESKRVNAHHLSYNSEIIVFLCGNCHNAIHAFARWTLEQKNKALGWIEKYSSEWTNGTEKYYKSAYYKKVTHAKANKNFVKRHPEKVKAWVKQTGKNGLKTIEKELGKINEDGEQIIKKE